MAKKNIYQLAVGLDTEGQVRGRKEDRRKNEEKNGFFSAKPGGSVIKLAFCMHYKSI